jgi:glutamate carboxypeptidase
MQPDTTPILQWLADQQGAMVALLEQLVNIDSGSYDKAGVDRVGERLQAFLAEEGVEAKRTPIDEAGDIFRFASGDGLESGRSNFLLMGHRDTVFDKGDAARRPFAIRGNRAYGPGVADMKGGLVMNAFILAAFKRFAPAVPVVFLTTGDEEIGSQASITHIDAEAKRAKAAFNAEPGRISGNVVSGRKGGFTYRFTITGKAAHSGVNFLDGTSAISELAHKIIALDRLTNVEEGVTLNVGVIGGGTTINTIAAHAEAGLDVRFVTREQREGLIRDIEAVFAGTTIAGTTTSFDRKSESLPLAPSSENDALTASYLASAQELGYDIGAEFTGGCADSGIASWAGAPTICGTGPVGGKAHTEDEYMEVDTLSQRARVVAATIGRLAAAG